MLPMCARSTIGLPTSVRQPMKAYIPKKEKKDYRLCSFPITQIPLLFKENLQIISTTHREDHDCDYYDIFNEEVNYLQLNHENEDDSHSTIIRELSNQPFYFAFDELPTTVDPCCVEDYMELVLCSLNNPKLYDLQLDPKFCKNFEDFTKYNHIVEVEFNNNKLYSNEDLNFIQLETLFTPAGPQSHPPVEEVVCECEALWIEDLEIMREPNFDVLDLVLDIRKSAQCIEMLISDHAEKLECTNLLDLIVVPVTTQESILEVSDILIEEIIFLSSERFETHPSSAFGAFEIDFIDSYMLNNGRTLFHSQELDKLQNTEIEFIPWPSIYEQVHRTFAQFTSVLSKYPSPSLMQFQSDIIVGRDFIALNEKPVVLSHLDVLDAQLDSILSQYWSVATKKKLTLTYPINVHTVLFSLAENLSYQEREYKHDKPALTLNEFISMSLISPIQLIKHIMDTDIAPRELTIATTVTSPAICTPPATAAHEIAPLNNTMKSILKDPALESQRIFNNGSDFSSIINKVEYATEGFEFNDLQNKDGMEVIASVTAPNAKQSQNPTVPSTVISSQNTDLYIAQVFTLLMSEQTFEANSNLISILGSQYKINVIDYPFRDAADIVVSEVACIKLVEVHHLEDITLKRELIRGLCNLTSRFAFIWILVKISSSNTYNLAENLVQLSQSLARFPSRTIVRSYTNTSLPTTLRKICDNDLMLSKKDDRLLSSYYRQLYCVYFIDRPDFSAICDFLQQFPTINVYLAALLVLVFPTLKSLTEASPEQMKEHLSRYAPTSKVELLTTNLASFAIILNTLI